MHLVTLFHDSKQNTIYATEMDIGKNIFYHWILILIFIVIFLYIFMTRKGKQYFWFWNCLNNNLTEKQNCWKTWNCFRRILITWTLDKGPLVVLFFGTKAGVKNHLVAVHSNKLQGSSGRPFHAVSSPRIARVVAPATPRLLQALSAGSQPGAILGCKTRAWTSML